MGRVLIAGLVGGIVVFAWGAVFHMVLPFGTVGLQNLPGEDVVLPAIRQAVPGPGLYYFPGMDRSSARPAAQRDADEKAWVEKYRRGPSGLLVVERRGRDPLSSSRLAIELLSNIAGALVAAGLLATSRPGGGYGARVGFVTFLGLFAPGDYTAMAMIEQVLSWLFAGLAIAAIVRSLPAPSSPAHT